MANEIHEAGHFGYRNIAGDGDLEKLLEILMASVASLMQNANLDAFTFDLTQLDQTKGLRVGINDSELFVIRVDHDPENPGTMLGGIQ